VPTDVSCAPDTGFEIGSFHRDGGHGEQSRGVLAIRQHRIAVLKQTHRPSIFSPLLQATPVSAATATIETYVAAAVSNTRFNHRGEENGVSYLAAID